jgi:hypothetical protein
VVHRCVVRPAARNVRKLYPQFYEPLRRIAIAVAEKSSPDNPVLAPFVINSKDAHGWLSERACWRRLTQYSASCGASSHSRHLNHVPGSETPSERWGECDERLESLGDLV